MTPVIEVRGVTRRFGRQWALAGLDLEVGRGEVVAILGANGAGKTTLLRVLATLLRPTGGEVRVLGHALPGGEQAVRAGAALMTPTGYAYDELTGLENLRFAARMSGVSPDRARLEPALAAVGLGEAAGQRVHGYSSGMRKRLELARLGLRPLELALLDEPFASLDEGGVEHVQAAVAEWSRTGTAVLIASHQRAEALRHAHRVLRLEAGRVLDEGPA